MPAASTAGVSMGCNFVVSAAPPSLRMWATVLVPTARCHKPLQALHTRRRSSLFSTWRISEELSFRDDSGCQPTQHDGERRFPEEVASRVPRISSLHAFERGFLGERYFYFGVSGAILRPRLNRVERGLCCRN